MFKSIKDILSQLRGKPARLQWTRLPNGSAHAITRRGQIYTVLYDTHKRKWVVLGTDGAFLGSAMRINAAKQLAQAIEERS